MENLNLIRKLAWTFAQKTNQEYEELFSEAALAYCEALQTFDPEAGVKATTYAWNCMKNHLINYCKKEYQLTPINDNRLSGQSPPLTSANFISEMVEEIIWHGYLYENNLYTTQPESTLEEAIAEWPKDCQTLTQLFLAEAEELMLENPHFRRKYQSTPRKTRKRIRARLQKIEWEDARINQVFEDMQVAVASL